MIGYDLDGTICEEKYIDFANMPFQQIVLIRLSCKLLRLPKPNSVIITARPVIDKEHTELWLKKHNIKCPVYYVGTSNHSKDEVCKNKLKKIKELKLSSFYENDDYICNYLIKHDINVIKC